MPIDLNRETLESLSERIGALAPQRVVVSNDGIIIRRRTTPGFDCGVGLSGRGIRRANTSDEAAKYMLKQSAARTDKRSLGGETSFNDFEKAIESVRKGETTPTGPSPASKALRHLIANAGLHSYRVRAQDAREALAKGDIDKATRQLEAISSHATNNGRLKDVERAQVALDAIRDGHELSGELPPTQAKIGIRVEGSRHYVTKDGSDVSTGLTRSEAEHRKAFMTRQAARSEDVAAIEKEISDLPSPLQEDSETPAAA